MFTNVFKANSLEFPIIYTSSFNPINMGSKNSPRYTIIATKINGSYKFYVNKYLSLKQDNFKNSADFKKEFTGIAKILDQDANIISSHLYDEGKIIARLDKENSAAERNISSSKYMPLLRSYIIVRTFQVTDWWRSDGSGGWVYTNTTIRGYSDEVVWNDRDYNRYGYWNRSGQVDTSGGGGDGPYGSTYTGVAPIEEATIKKINERNDEQEQPVEIIDSLTGKADCVYQKLKQLSGGFKNAIQKFDGEFPVSHLKFSMANLADNTRAITIPPEDYVIEIQVNNDQSNNGVDHRPNLMTAKTLIHEVIHAEMWRKVLSIIDNGGDVEGLTKPEWKEKLSSGDYPGIYYYYSHYGINEFQHPQMATHYRNVIADILEEFDNSVHSRQFYMDIAWEGLRYSNIPAWSNLDPEEKERINDVISNYNTNNSDENCD